jgi:hypothetical protein
MRFYSVCLIAVTSGTLLLTACNSQKNDTSLDDREVGLRNPSESGMETGDASATSLVKRGMVVPRDTEKKQRGTEKNKQVTYRFHPFDNDETRLRLTTASFDEGKGIAEQKEIDLGPYSTKTIEVSGSSFGQQWVFDAKITGEVKGDSVVPFKAGNTASDTMKR